MTMAWPNLLHVTAAVLAILLGAFVLLTPKGTPGHRMLGRIYIFLIITVNALALSIYEDQAVGPFHYLAVLSLATIAAGGVAGWRMRTNRAWIWTHAYFMAWSYAGLLAAGTGQLAVIVHLSVPWSIIATLAVCAVVIHTRVGPAALILRKR